MRPAPFLLYVFLTLAGGPAFAQGYSIDLEFVRPDFGHLALPGVAVAEIDEPRTFRYGLMLQYEQDPLTIWDPNEGVERGAVVANRGAMAVGASFDATSWLAFGVMVPAAASWATQLPELAADGVGVGDVAGGVKFVVPLDGALSLGLRLGATLPTGLQLTYLGEESPRFLSGLLAGVDVGSVSVSADAGVTIREDTPTVAGFVQGDELSLGFGCRVPIPGTENVDAYAVVLGRAGFPSFLGGGAENSAEAMLGAAIRPIAPMSVDLAVGRGLTEGYGTTDLRILSQVTMHTFRAPPPPPEIVEVQVPVYIEILSEALAPEPPKWAEGELARIEENKIVIRDMPQFVVDTNILLESSKPTLQAVADVLNGDGRITAVGIVGHASQEGTYEHNYALSTDRARAIFEELVRDGVHPSRLTYRGMGETIVLVPGEDEASLQWNRRVEFLILRLVAADEVEKQENDILLPWNGDKATVREPKVPLPAEPDPGGLAGPEELKPP